MRAPPHTTLHSSASCDGCDCRTRRALQRLQRLEPVGPPVAQLLPPRLVRCDDRLLFAACGQHPEELRAVRLDAVKDALPLRLLHVHLVLRAARDAPRHKHPLLHLPPRLAHKLLVLQLDQHVQRHRLLLLVRRLPRRVQLERVRAPRRHLRVHRAERRHAVGPPLRREARRVLPALHAGCLPGVQLTEKLLAARHAATTTATEQRDRCWVGVVALQLAVRGEVGFAAQPQRPAAAVGRRLALLCPPRGVGTRSRRRCGLPPQRVHVQRREVPPHQAVQARPPGGRDAEPLRRRLRVDRRSPRRGEQQPRQVRPREEAPHGRFPDAVRLQKEKHGARGRARPAPRPSSLRRRRRRRRLPRKRSRKHGS
eukprot:Rhum_TRINITY_DN21221_c0_g1::Rhum_TRINITY_DN21221_c0_g1_i1::g.173505::m.173505